MSIKADRTAKIRIVVNSALCTGCRCCELACSLVHQGECNPELGVVRVTKDVFSGDYEVQTCLQCDEPRCQIVCPVEAIYFDEKTGVTIIDESNCTGCMVCEEECPLHMVRFIPEKYVCFKCDLCGGNPQCVTYCPYGALTINKK